MALDVVALRASGVGDLLTAVPVLRALADQYGGVCLATSPWLFPLARLIPGVTSTVPVDGLAPRRDLTGTVAFNLHGSGPQSHTALLNAAPRQLVAFRCEPIWENGPDWSTEACEPERERLCRLARSVGIHADAQRLEIHRPPSKNRGTTVLHVGGKDPDRRWPDERFAELAVRLEGHDIVLTGGPEDVASAARVAWLAGLPDERVLAGKIGLQELAGVVAGSRILVSGDTGAAHLAYALGTPAVVIFGPAPPGQWGPPASADAIVLRGPGEAPPAEVVDVDDVAEAVLSVAGRS